MKTDTTLSLKELLALIKGVLVQENSENPNFIAVAPLHLANKETISFLANEKYLDEAKKTNAGVLLCSKNVVPALSENTSTILVVCENPYAAFAKVSQIFFKLEHPYSGISPQAIVDASAKVPSSATLFPNVFVGPGAVVGERTVIYPGVFIGAGCTIGDDCVLYPNVVVREGCNIGNRCILNPGVVIGGEGFGFAPTLEENIKIPQIGGVNLADDVEIGANSAIDRGTIQNTTVGKQTKIDNLVTIGHNAEIGEFCFLAGQTGIAGSTKLGKRVITAGQAGITGHLNIGDNTTIGPQSGVTKDVPSGQTWLGTPARPYKEFVKWVAILNRFVASKEKEKNR